jgi:tRNA threonylcarbamoyladenosine biosynthesis protein TsaE
MIRRTSSVGATRSFGAQVASITQSGDIYALEGELGTGKTEFVRGFVNELDERMIVRSPSFSILNIYTTPHFPVYHFDFYRLCNASELDEIGFDEYIVGDGVFLIEWGTMFPTVLPAHTRLLQFRDISVSEREIVFDFKLDAPAGQ